MLYLDSIRFSVVDQKKNRKDPRPRYLEYQNDLFKISNSTLDGSTLLLGGQLSYTELSDCLFQDVEISEFSKSIDLLVLSYWTPEFDPDYSAFGPYLHNKLCLSCKSFDVTDCGSISSLMAVYVLKKYMETDGNVENALLVSLEQNSIPLTSPQNAPVPLNSVAGFLKISKNIKSNVALIDSNIVTEGQVTSNEFIHTSFIQNILSINHIDQAKCTILLRRDSCFYKLLRIQMNRKDTSLSELNFEFLKCNYSSMNLFEWLSKISKKPGCTGTIMFIEEDLESLEVGYILVQIGRNK